MEWLVMEQMFTVFMCFLFSDTHILPTYVSAAVRQKENDLKWTEAQKENCLNLVIKTELVRVSGFKLQPLESWDSITTIVIKIEF